MAMLFGAMAALFGACIIALPSLLLLVLLRCRFRTVKSRVLYVVMSQYAAGGVLFYALTQLYYCFDYREFILVAVWSGLGSLLCCYGLCRKFVLLRWLLLPICGTFVLGCTAAAAFYLLAPPYDFSLWWVLCYEEGLM
ncbi:hypothetical protein ACK1TF_000181 [Salmonella enterica]